MNAPTVGPTLSGGGFRATAFGLGCLRALHDTGVLTRVTVVSGVSGGSLLAALWAYGPEDFSEFDETTTRLLRDGLQAALARRVLSPAGLARSAASATGSFLPPAARTDRPYNRTDALRAVLAARAFGDRLVSDPTRPALATVLNATDLITSRAVRFGSRNSSSSQHGTITDPVTVAEAVAASAAFPLLLPAIERTYAFERKGTVTRTKVNLTDGGVYDNLVLSCLTPPAARTTRGTFTAPTTSSPATPADRRRAHPAPGCSRSGSSAASTSPTARPRTQAAAASTQPAQPDTSTGSSSPTSASRTTGSPCRSLAWSPSRGSTTTPRTSAR